MATSHEASSCGPDRLSGVDKLFVALEGIADFNPSVLGGGTFKQRMELSSVLQVLQTMVESSPRLRQRIGHTNGLFKSAIWEDVPKFEARDMLEVVEQDNGAIMDQEGLNREFAKLADKSWDYSQPLWSVVFVEKYEDGNGGRSALLMRAHHAISDGQGFALSLLLASSLRPMILEAAAVKPSQRKVKRQHLLAPSKLHPALELYDDLLHDPFTSIFISGLMLLALLGRALFNYTISAAYTLRAASHVNINFCLGMIRGVPHITPTRSLEGEEMTVVGKEFASTEASNLSEWKEIAKGMGAGIGTEDIKITINDVAVSIVADCLAMEIESQTAKEPLSYSDKLFGRRKIVLSIPKSLRAPNDLAMRNAATLTPAFVEGLTATIPSAEEIREHVVRTSSELNVCKYSHYPYLLYLTGNLFGRLFPISSAISNLPQHSASLPLRITRSVISTLLQRSTTAVFTNVPTPTTEPITVGGVEFMNWTGLPPSGGMGTAAISLWSYAGTIQISIATEVRQTRDGVKLEAAAKRFRDRVEERFDLYLHAARGRLRGQGRSNPESKGVSDFFEYSVTTSPE